MSVHQLLVGAVQKCPNATAVQYQGGSATWKQLQQRVAARAEQLKAMGLKAGDRVAVLSANVPECLEAHYAVFWAGMVLVPLNTRLSVAEQTYILGHCECAHLLHDERNAGLAEQLGQELPAMSASQLTPLSQWGGKGDPLAQQPQMPFQPCHHDATAAIFYTGGTTGRPKGVELTHIAVLIQAMSAKDNYELDESTVLLHNAPMFHLADFTVSMAATAALGRHSFMPEFSPEGVLDGIENEGVSVVIMVPTMITGVLQAATGRKQVFTRLKKILYGTAPIQEPLLLQLLADAPGVGLVQIYGQSEAGGGCTVLFPDRHVLQGPLAGKLKSAGRCIPAFMLRIVDAQGNVAPNGEVGEIQLAGPGIMKSYWKEPVLTAQTIRDGWLSTGDLGVLDDEGFVTIAGRLKDMIITGGENVFAGEVESALMFHDAVEAAAVIGVPDEKWGESVHAVVCLKPGRTSSPEELIAFCRGRIAHYKAPRSVALREVPLPLSGVGKVRKVDLLTEWKATRN
ncbi:AMP-binding protein [Diaphorobacter ruginosibacter]|uniref:class I adenylate-forming enzyme family protein n=1 Tax=Diaphorobacter ruginosibacter TaxID=1715720 RepID=UPI003340C741